MSTVTKSVEIGTNDEKQGVPNMILVKQDDGMFLVGTSTVDGEQFLSVDAGQIPVGTYNIEMANAVEYANLVLEESAIELVGQLSSERNVNGDEESGNGIINIINNIKSNLTSGFNHINERIRRVSKRCNNLEKTIDGIIKEVKDNGLAPRVAVPFGDKKCGSIVIGVDPSDSTINDFNDDQGAKSQMKLHKLQGLKSHPNGSWLGDPKNEEKRIRCPIKEMDLKYLNASCATPEKMALSLLDYLFDRETQANSNISGTSKRGKKQLDPIKIYGIRCHLEYLFQITNKDWLRIKQNIDSKCRTSFRRKAKGMPLKVKAFKSTMPMTKNNEEGEALKFILAKPKTNENSSFEDLALKNELKSVGEIFTIQNANQEIRKYTPKNTVPISIHTADGLTFSLPAETVEQNSQIIQVHTDGNYEIIQSTAGGEFSQLQLENAQILEQFENQVERQIVVGSQKR